MQVSVQDVMMRQPPTIRHDAGLDEALETLLREDAGEIYVIDDSSKLLGVLPDYELLKAKLIGTLSDATVETLMSRHFTTVSASMLTTEIAALFRTGTCRQLAVVEDGRLIGQITRRDILRQLATLERVAEECEPASTHEEAIPLESTLHGPHHAQRARPSQQQVLQG